MIYREMQIPVGEGSVLLKAYCPDVNREVEPERKRPAVVICPGGGYHFRSFREDEPVALQFLAQGLNAFVVEYRVAPDRFPKPQQDAGAAVAYVRQHAEEFRTDPDCVALLGFSAGGHLAASVGVMNGFEAVWSEIGLTWRQVRPDVLVLCYPVITAGPYAHRGSIVNLSGSEDTAAQERFSLEKLVSAQTPPAFLWHTWTDGAVPVLNTLLFASALAEHHVPAEVHIYPEGVHGLSLGNEQTCDPKKSPALMNADIADWPKRAADFIKRQEEKK